MPMRCSRPRDSEGEVWINPPLTPIETSLLQSVLWPSAYIHYELLYKCSSNCKTKVISEFSFNFIKRMFWSCLLELLKTDCSKCQEAGDKILPLYSFKEFELRDIISLYSSKYFQEGFSPSLLLEQNHGTWKCTSSHSYKERMKKETGYSWGPNIT